MTSPSAGTVTTLDFEGLPFTQVSGPGDLIPNPGSVLTDDFMNAGVIFGLGTDSLGVAVVRSDDLAPSSGLNSVAGLNANGILPGGIGAVIGDIYFSFVVPGTMIPCVTDFVSFTIGDVGGDVDEFIIRSFNQNNIEIDTQFVSGVERFAVSIAMSDIHRVEIDFLGVFGYSLDDLQFNFCLVDLDCSGEVGITDFLQLLSLWGQLDVPADFDGGGVGITDFLELLANWGPCP